jgi:hypothetical protein
MRWSRGALAATILVALAVMQLPASAHTKSEKTTIHLTEASAGAPGFAAGEIEARSEACVTDRRVNVFENKRLVATTTTDEAGFWEVEGQIDHGDRLYARVDKKVLRKTSRHKHRCNSDVSNTIALPFELSVTVVGDGTVTSDIGGLTCTAEVSPCQELFDPGSRPTLSATPEAGASFTAWSGDCTGTGSCAPTMSQNRAVTATFSTAPIPETRVLEISVSGPGRVTGPGLNCTSGGGDCNEDYPINQQVTITATPNNATTQFEGWGGSCAGAATTCSVTMNIDRAASATFSSVLPPPLDGLLGGLLDTLLGLLGLA